MKIVIRLFNLIIMALSAAAAVCLFIVPAMTFKSNIALNVKTFSQFIPTTDYTTDINIPQLLGTDVIHVGISFTMDTNGLQKAMNGDKATINDMFINNNVKDITQTLHEPIDLITDFTIRSVIKKAVRQEITAQVEAAVTQAGTGNAQEIVEDELGDAYFTDFSNALYDSANEDGATIDSVSNVLYWQIDEALKKADGGSGTYSSSFDESKKEDIKNNLINTLDGLQLVESDGKLKKIGHLSYIYISDFLKKELQTKVADPAVLNQAVGETLPMYADRLLNLYVITLMPDMFYQVIGYVSLALYIGLFVFAGIWGILFLITLIRTFTKKPWTIFGPWFWFFGSLQLVIGLGLTIVGKFVVPGLDLTFTGLPIQSVILAPRTYTLIPSIIYVVCIVLAIVYAIFKSIAKKEAK